MYGYAEYFWIVQNEFEGSADVPRTSRKYLTNTRMKMFSVVAGEVKCVGPISIQKCKHSLPKFSVIHITLNQQTLCLNCRVDVSITVQRTNTEAKLIRPT